MINDIYKYKKALVYVNELTKLETSMLKALNDLTLYKKYIPAQDCISALQDNLAIVQIHLNHQKKIVANKGQK